MGGISGCRVASYDAMLTMLVCATHWLYMHIYTHAHMSMHGTCLLVCHPCCNTMKLWTFDPNLHLSLADTTFCLLSCLFVCYLFCLFACILASFLAMSIALICFMPLYTHSASFPSIVCLLVSCFCLCMYICGARTHRARARSPKRKQKGRGCEHADVSRAAAVSRFRV